MKEEDRVADLALEAAADLLEASDRVAVVALVDGTLYVEGPLAVIVAAYLDSLLGGLPEEPLKAADVEMEAPSNGRSDIEETSDVLLAFLRSLRSGLERDGDR